MIETDIIVVGGGPAGSTIAFLLASLGWRITLLEKERFPRFQVGESLLPYNNDLFHRLGIVEELDRRGFVDKRGAEFVTATGESRQKFLFRQSLPEEYSRSYQVRRSEFDQILLESARGAGVNAVESARVTRVELDDPDRAVVTWTGENGDVNRTEGRFLVDASGADGRVIGSMVRRVENQNLRKISLFAHYEGVKPPADGSGDITITILRDGWTWLIPIDDATTSFGVVLDCGRWGEMGLDKARLLEETIRATPYLQERMSSSRRTSEVFARKDFSYRVDRMSGSNFVLVGDTAGFVDPIFSTGVFLAMKSAELASDAVDSRLRTGRSRGLKRYERKMRKVLERYLRIIEYFYRREFIEVFLHPQPRFGLVTVVVGLLAGNAFETLMNRWKMELFYFLVWIQGRKRVIAPPIPWDKLPTVGGERVPEVNVV